MALVLVDTSVWVDALRDPNSPAGAGVSDLLSGSAGVVTAGLVIQEVMQGLRVPSQIARVSTLLCGLPCLRVGRDTHLKAATLYRKLRGRGLTIPTVDVLLAVAAIEHGVRLWSNDTHFALIAQAARLRLYGAPS
jgi:predicted nucleic acid-binding protein